MPTTASAAPLEVPIRPGSASGLRNRALQRRAAGGQRRAHAQRRGDARQQPQLGQQRIVEVRPGQAVAAAGQGQQRQQQAGGDQAQQQAAAAVGRGGVQGRRAHIFTI
ncbi:hypothetical protein JOS77_18060 [Chromobacterium haemolyticum]|nr:hypothetical protein JOS77_18060 [Chromobacterium haemolyticum]